MPTLHKVVFAESMNVSDVVADFLVEFCPEHGQLGESECHYVNKDGVRELKDILEDMTGHEEGEDAYLKNKDEIMRTLNAMATVVDAEGLYEFHLEN